MLNILQTERLLGSFEAAKLADCSVMTIWRAAKAKKLPVAVVNGGKHPRRMYRRSDVETWVRERAKPVSQVVT